MQKYTFEEFFTKLKEAIIDNLKALAVAYNIDISNVKFSKDPTYLRTFVAKFGFNKKQLQKEVGKVKKMLETKFHMVLEEKTLEELMKLAEKNKVKNLAKSDSKEVVIKKIMIDVGHRFNEKIIKAQSDVIDYLRKTLSKLTLDELLSISKKQKIKSVSKNDSKEVVVDKLIAHFEAEVSKRIHLREARLAKEEKKVN